MYQSSYCGVNVCYLPAKMDVSRRNHVSNFV